MGEAKRKKEAVLNGPCPCGDSKESARHCCFDGRGWHKPAAILGLKTLPPGGLVARCYMKELGSCVGKISGEHVISDSVCKVLMDGGEFSISGVPWLEAGEVKIIPPIEANCLCVKHNSSLSPLDSAAKHFFASLKSFLKQDDGSRHTIISGHDLERWLLKSAKAAAVSGNLAQGKIKLSGAFSQDASLLNMLDDPHYWPEGAGLYCVMNTGDMTENTLRFQFQPLINDHGEIEALGVNIMGFRFVLLLESPNLTKYPFLEGARYRPNRIVISYPLSTNWLTMCWDDGKEHDILKVQWVRDS